MELKACMARPAPCSWQFLPKRLLPTAVLSGHLSSVRLDVTALRSSLLSVLLAVFQSPSPGSSSPLGAESSITPLHPGDPTEASTNKEVRHHLRGPLPAMLHPSRALLFSPQPLLMEPTLRSSSPLLWACRLSMTAVVDLSSCVVTGHNIEYENSHPWARIPVFSAFCSWLQNFYITGSSAGH